MRPWTQRNVVAWVRRLGPDWDVRVLDKVPGSPHNVTNFVDEKLLPPTFWHMEGRHAGQHSSDIARILLLYLHGGFWVDVGGVLTRHLDDLWNRIIDQDDPTEVVGIVSGRGEQYVEDLPLTNVLLASRKGNQFMGLWYDVFAEVWKDRTTARDARLHPLYVHLVPFQLPRGFPVEVSAADMSDYLTQWHAAGRLFALIDPSRGWNGPAFYRNHLMLLRADEVFIHNLLTMYQGERQFSLLANPRTESLDTNQTDSQAFVETVLAHSICVKLSQGLLPRPIQLATLWDRDENDGMDVKPGTWAEYFRWASVHLDQTRALAPLTTEEKETRRPKRVWTAGVLQPIEDTTPVRANV